MARSPSSRWLTILPASSGTVSRDRVGGLWKIANTAAHEAADRETEARNEVGRLTQLLVDYRPLAVTTPELQAEQVALLEESCSVVGSIDLKQIDTSSQRVRGALRERP